MRGFKHFFSVPPIQTAELTVRGIGVQERMPACIIDRPRGTGDYLFMFFYDPVWIGAGQEPAPRPALTLMIWTPGRAQYYGDRTHPFNHTWMHCDGTFIRSLLKKNRLPVNVPQRFTDPSLMEQHLLDIHAELTRHAPPDGIIVHNLIENWLRATARTLQPRGRADAVPENLLAVRHFIESQPAEPWTLPELAKRAHLSPSHFSAEFRKHFGAAPIEYLIRHRLHQAAHLLHDRTLKIAEISERVGYADLFQFSKLFKKHFGVSPRAWRRNNS